MRERHPELVIPSGTQVVTRVELRDAAGNVLRPRGAVGVIIETLSVQAGCRKRRVAARRSMTC